MVRIAASFVFELGGRLNTDFAWMMRIFVRLAANLLPAHG
jgi:hypothetical protein